MSMVQKWLGTDELCSRHNGGTTWVPFLPAKPVKNNMIWC